MQLATPPTLPPAPADDRSHQDWVARMARGDRDALSQLYRAYQPRLARFLSRQTWRSELIDEVINDSFWAAWQGASRFRAEARVSTWLMGIAHRQMLKALRDRGELAQAEPEGDAWHDPVDPGAAHEHRDWLHKGMAELNDAQREVLELAYAFGHSMEEIAAILDEPVGTVKARLFHARIKLRNRLPELASPSTRQA